MYSPMHGMRGCTAPWRCVYHSPPCEWCACDHGLEHNTTIHTPVLIVLVEVLVGVLDATRHRATRPAPALPRSPRQRNPVHCTSTHTRRLQHHTRERCRPRFGRPSAGGPSLRPRTGVSGHESALADTIPVETTPCVRAAAPERAGGPVSEGCVESAPGGGEGSKQSSQGRRC
jgi:hypothetical protein